MAKNFRIYPSFGIARVGNSPEQGFLGPEFPDVPANWDFATAAFKKFKDTSGKILRQGVRFRVFEMDDSGNTIGEVLPGRGEVAEIKWKVHVANLKASFFRFEGPTGGRRQIRTSVAERSRS